MPTQTHRLSRWQGHAWGDALGLLRGQAPCDGSGSIIKASKHISHPANQTYEEHNLLPSPHGGSIFIGHSDTWMSIQEKKCKLSHYQVCKKVENRIHVLENKYLFKIITLEKEENQSLRLLNKHQERVLMHLKEPRVINLPGEDARLAALGAKAKVWLYNSHC